MIDEISILSFVKYCIVGFSGMLFDFGITFILKEKLKINKYISNSTGFLFSASSNYVLNRFWTFQSEDPHIITQYSLFLFISLIGLALNNLVLYLIHEKLKFNFWVSKILAVITVTLFNFLMNSLITFR